LDAGRRTWLLDAWTLTVLRWLLAAGCWLLDASRWMPTVLRRPSWDDRPAPTWTP